MTNAYTEGTWYVHIKDLNCTGNESSIFDCPMNGIPGYSCNHRDDASVICQCECLMWPSAIFININRAFSSLVGNGTRCNMNDCRYSNNRDCKPIE